MGNLPSNPVDESTKQEIAELIKAILGTFTLNYVKEYALAMVLKIKMEANEKPESWNLLERPPWSEDYKSGWLIKEGAVRKNWKKRYFVVRPNYTIDYYENEAEAKKEKGKKRGSISVAGYRVIEDVNDGVLKRLHNMAEKMGMSVSDLPKGKEYPKYTFELHHSRRRCYFIQCENEEEFKQWVEQFKTCCRRAWGLKNLEFCHKKAFNEAIRKTRWEIGHWSWWSYGGSEEQILSDLISEEIDWKVMGRIYGKISGPWVVRNTVRNQVLKALDTMVSAAVGPAWKAMEKAVEELRPKIEPTIKDMVGPIFKAEAELIEKMKQGAMSIIDPILQEHVVPHLSKIMAVVKAPMNQAFDVSYGLFDEEISKFEIKGGLTEVKKEFYHLDWYARSWKMWPAVEKTDVMYEPLWALHTIFSDIWPWGLIWTAHDAVRSKMDNAIYTFEQKLVQQLENQENASEDDKKELVSKTKALIMTDYKSDGQKATQIYYHEILKTIIMPPFEKLVIPACKTIIDPVADLVPEPLKQFLDPNQMFEDLINGIVDASIDTILNSDVDERSE
jgi:hypothetical protein